jgi:YbbR domain-containing protein
MKIIRGILRLIPTIITAVLLGVAVWVSAVTSTDPNVEQTFASPIPVRVQGMDPSLVLTGSVPESVVVTIKAPRSIQLQLSADPNLIRATVNLSGLGAGRHTVEPQVSIGIGPTQITKVTPSSLEFSIEQMLSRTLEVEYRQTGNLPISYSSGNAILEHDQVEISGPKPLVDQVTQVIAEVDLTDVNTTVARMVELKPLDSRGAIVRGLNLNPTQIRIEVPIRQLGGYKNVFVKVVTSGQINSGYLITGLLVDPPNVTVYSPDPEIARAMPDFVETMPIDLTGGIKSFEIDAELNLPEGVSPVSVQNVKVTVEIAAVENTRRLYAVPVQVINQGRGLTVTLVPNSIDLVVVGPVNILDRINNGNVKVTLDLADKTEGTYQLVPTVTLDPADALRLGPVPPTTIEVRITR